MNWCVLLLFGSAWALPPLEEWKGRIINGSDAKRHQFPYIVSIHQGGHICGASILSHTWVLSAGHCFKYKDKSFTAIAGLLNQGETHPDIQEIPISKIIVHPKYIWEPMGTIQNDIALLNLERPLVFSKAVQPVKLPGPNEAFSGRVWLAGWGAITEPVETFPITLQCLEMSMITNIECQKAGSTIWFVKILDQMMCTTSLPTNHHSIACHGDSGGPLVQNGVLIGIQ